MSWGDMRTQTAAASSRWITDPRQLPITIQPEAQIYIKTAQNYSQVCTDGSAANFFSALALRGAQASVSVADTYVTCASLSGRGRLYCVIPPSYAGGVFTPTARITVDGIAYTIAPSTTIAANRRMVIGTVTPGVPGITAGATYSTADFSLPNSYNDQGFKDAMVGGFFVSTTSNIALVAPEVIEAYNLPFLQFESSCLIEFKTSLLATGSGDKTGGAVYRMLP